MTSLDEFNCSAFVWSPGTHPGIEFGRSFASHVTSRVHPGEAQLPCSLTGVVGKVAHNALRKMAVISDTYEVNFDGRTFQICIPGDIDDCALWLNESK